MICFSKVILLLCCFCGLIYSYVSKDAPQIQEDGLIHNNVQYITNKDIIFRICDYCYATRASHHPLNPEQCQNSSIPTNSIICVRGDKRILESFFKTCLLAKPFTLLTLESDENVPQLASWMQTPNLKKWYGWNALDNSGVLPIPIGLNHDSMLDPIRQARVTPWSEKKDKVLLAFKPHLPERHNLNSLARKWDFAESLQYKNTYKSASTQVDLYEQISSYKFIACPRGTGQDTHRVWEALYLGSIPIVIKSHISSLYVNLPVLQLNSWEELTQFRLDDFHAVWQYKLASTYRTNRDVSSEDLTLYREGWNNSIAILDTWITTIKGEQSLDVPTFSW